MTSMLRSVSLYISKDTITSDWICRTNLVMGIDLSKQNVMKLNMNFLLREKANKQQSIEKIFH